MQVPSSSVGPHNAKKNPTILTELTDHAAVMIQGDRLIFVLMKTIVHKRPPVAALSLSIQTASC